MLNLDLYSIISRVLVVVLLLPVHEFAHAWASYKLGDNTANYSGRLTLNPFAHLDPIGTILLILTGYGWARPVPVNPRNFKDRKLGMGLTALAGPVSNVLVSYVLLLICKGIIILDGKFFFNPTSVNIIFQVVSQMAWISVVLAVFNMVPEPPLDGSKVILMVLPYKWYFKVLAYERYIYIALMVLLFTGVLSYPIGVVSNYIFNGLCFLSGL